MSSAEQQLVLGNAANGLITLSNILCEIEDLSASDIEGLSYILGLIGGDMQRTVEPDNLEVTP